MDAEPWNTHYAAAGFVYGTEPDDFLAVTAVDHSKAGRDFEILRELERDVREGTGRTGRGAVVQTRARRQVLRILKPAASSSSNRPHNRR